MDSSKTHIENHEYKKNKLLPYNELIDDEAANSLNLIKTNLGLCILLSEPRKPLQFWLRKLTWYTEMYGLKFSKNDHILFVQLLYDLLTDPKLPFESVKLLCTTLKVLLKKKELIKPGEDLILPWKPIYNSYIRIYDRDYLSYMYHQIYADMLKSFDELLQHIQYYFDPLETENIWHELKIYLCPFSSKMAFGIQLLGSFLPICSLPSLADKTHQLWFEEIMNLWNICDKNSSHWEDKIQTIFASNKSNLFEIISLY